MQAREDSDHGDGDRARLFFEGVSSPVVTHVRNRSAKGMVVAQELPFLSLASDVRDEDGRRARIRSVGVTVEGDTPHLVLELAWARRGDATLPSFAIGEGERPRRRDDTQPYGFIPRASELAGGDAPKTIDAPVLESVARRESEAPIVFRIEADASPAAPPQAPPAGTPSKWGFLRTWFSRPS